MNKTRYKIRKEQLERVVESFVTESVAPESKKHVQGYKDTEDESLGMKDGKESTKKASVKGRRDDSKGKWGNRLKHASEAKKHRMSMGTEQSNDMGQGMKKAPQTIQKQSGYILLLVMLLIGSLTLYLTYKMSTQKIKTLD